MMRTRLHQANARKLRKLLFVGTSSLLLLLQLIPQLDAFFINNQNNDPRQSTEDFGTYCAAEQEAYANCVFRMEPASAGKACDDCRISTFENMTDDAYYYSNNCEALEETLCTAVHSCGCGDCKDELEDFWRCTTEQTHNDTCSLDCFTPTTATTDGPLCPTEFDSYKTCVLDELEPDVGDACDSCRLLASSKIPNDVSDCSVVQDIFCHAVRTCDCQHCATPMHQYLDCDVNKRWFGECKVDCTNYDSNVATGGESSAAAAQQGDNGDNGGGVDAQITDGNTSSGRQCYSFLESWCVMTTTMIMVLLVVVVDGA